MYNRTDIVNALLSKGADVNAKNNRGQTAPMIASMCGYIDVINALLSKGVDVNAQDSIGFTALMYAVRFYQAETIRILLASGANVNLVNKYGQTARTMAFSTTRGRSEIARMFVDATAKKPIVSSQQSQRSVSTSRRPARR